jgi:hypothetical protein
VFTEVGLVNTERDIRFLTDLIGDRNMETVLLYKGSLHGFNSKDFHSRADKRGPTISLFKLDNREIVGGFTDA